MSSSATQQDQKHQNDKNDQTDQNGQIDQKDKDTVDQMYTKIESIKNIGNNFFKTKDYHNAISRYDIAIEEYSSFISNNTNISDDASLSKLKNMIGSIYNNRAFSYFRIEMYGQSAIDATQAIKLKFFKGYYRRGCSNIALGKLSSAKKDFQKASQKFPQNKDIKIKLKLSIRAFNQSQFFRAIQTDHGKPISSSINLSDFALPSSDYDGPKLINDNINCINKEWIKSLHLYQKKGNNLHIRYLVIIMLSALKLFQKMNNIEYFSLKNDNDNKLEDDDNNDNKLNENRITICGDIHGQYYDYLHIYKLNGLPSLRNAYLFNGDFVDRGSWSCEVIISMLSLKILYPSHLLMTRGNHETINMNEMYGFCGEVKHKYSQKIFHLFTELFNALPLGYVIGNKIFVCHGGLMKSLGAQNILISDLQYPSINRFQQPSLGNMTDLLWSDPQNNNGLSPSKRGGGIMFGPDITFKFLNNNNLSLIIRSHEVQEEGYKILHNGKLITIFSAPNYVDQMGNKAAFIILNKNYIPEFKQFTAQKHPNIKPMAYGGGAFNMANFM